MLKPEARVVWAPLKVIWALAEAESNRPISTTSNSAQTARTDFGRNAEVGVPRSFWDTEATSKVTKGLRGLGVAVGWLAD
jgi:hypothetical protein